MYGSKVGLDFYQMIMSKTKKPSFENDISTIIVSNIMSKEKLRPHFDGDVNIGTSFDNAVICQT